MFTHRKLLTFVLILSITPRLAAEDKRDFAEPSKEAIASYTKIGATYGARFVSLLNPGDFPSWGPAKPGETGGRLPVFAFAGLPKEPLPDLDVPFGLSLSFARINDENLASLAKLKHLTYLEFSSTSVTLTGLKSLKPLSHSIRN